MEGWGVGRRQPFSWRWVGHHCLVKSAGHPWRTWWREPTGLNTVEPGQWALDLSYVPRVGQKTKSTGFGWPLGVPEVILRFLPVNKDNSVRQWTLWSHFLPSRLNTEQQPRSQASVRRTQPSLVSRTGTFWPWSLCARGELGASSNYSISLWARRHLAPEPPECKSKRGIISSFCNLSFLIAHFSKLLHIPWWEPYNLTQTTLSQVTSSIPLTLGNATFKIPQ